MLKGKNIYLRTVAEADLPELYLYLNSIWMKGEHLSCQLLSEHQFRLEFYETGFWSEAKGTLLILKDGLLLGAVWFERQTFFDCLDLHFYIFKEEDRGRGLMKEALAIFCWYLFATKKTERLQISVPSYSKSALRVAQKCGFQFEGIARSALFSRGVYCDLCLYSLLRAESGPLFIQESVFGRDKSIEKIYS